MKIPKPKRIRFENLPEKDYFFWVKKYTQKGRLIKNNSRVFPTDWAIQNGVIEDDNKEYIKVRNCRNPEQIVVKKKGNRQGDTYWAGFWK